MFRGLKYRKCLKALSSSRVERRVAAVHGLVDMSWGGSRALQALFEALKDRESPVRKAVVWALGEFGDARAVGSLKDAAQDEELSVREATARTLGQLGGELGVGVLVQMLQDEAAAVREAAARALGIAHQRPSSSPLACRQGLLGERSRRGMGADSPRMYTHVHFLAGSWQKGLLPRLFVLSDVTSDVRKPLKTGQLRRFRDSSSALRFPPPPIHYLIAIAFLSRILSRIQSMNRLDSGRNSSWLNAVASPRPPT